MCVAGVGVAAAELDHVCNYLTQHGCLVLCVDRHPLEGGGAFLERQRRRLRAAALDWAERLFVVNPGGYLAQDTLDAIGAGEGELVLIAQGSAGRHTDRTDDAPVDAVIFAILDSLEVDGKTTFRKS